MYRILIVDDEQIVADTLSLIFKQHGFSTCTAYSADEAIVQANAFPPDLLLCDLNMPEKDGTALIAELGDAYPSCRVLVLTGSVTGASRVWALGNRLRKELSILSKPCPPSEVLAVAGSLLAA